MAFKMNGWNAGTNTGSQSPLNKNSGNDKDIKPRKGETKRQFMQRQTPGAKVDYHGPREVWDGTKWIKDTRSGKEQLVDNVKNLGEGLYDLYKKKTKK